MDGAAGNTPQLPLCKNLLQQTGGWMTSEGEKKDTPKEKDINWICSQKLQIPVSSSNKWGINAAKSLVGCDTGSLQGEGAWMASVTQLECLLKWWGLVFKFKLLGHRMKLLCTLSHRQLETFIWSQKRGKKKTKLFFQLLKKKKTVPVPGLLPLLTLASVSGVSSPNKEVIKPRCAAATQGATQPQHHVLSNTQELGNNTCYKHSPVLCFQI